MDVLFGELRSLLAGPMDDDEWGQSVLELSRRAFALDGRVWQEQWSGYIARAAPGLPSPLLEVHTVAAFESAASLLPGARLSLDTRWSTSRSGTVRSVFEGSGHCLAPRAGAR